MILDPTTPIGKMRLRVGDYGYDPIMPSEVYQSALDDCQNNLPRACVLVAQYILASLTGQTHQKISQIEVYGAEWFTNYLAFVKATILNPHLMTLSPMPYLATQVDASGNKIVLPLDQFQKDWNNNFANGTEAQQLRLMSLTNYPSNSPFSFYG